MKLQFDKNQPYQLGAFAASHIEKSGWYLVKTNAQLKLEDNRITFKTV